MRLMPARLLSGLALVVAGAFGAACAPAQEIPVDTSAEDRAAIDTLRGAWVTAYEAGDAAAVAGLYTTDATVMYPGEPSLNGRAAIQAHYEAEFAMGSYSSDITPSVTEVEGDMAVETGEFSGTMTPAGGGDASNVSGRYMVAIVRDAGGQWRLRLAMNNFSSPDMMKMTLDAMMSMMPADAGGGGS